MLKMKSALSIVAIFSLALVSCVQRLPEVEQPNVDNGAITMVKATVKPLSIEGLSGTGTYKWDGSLALGIYGTSGISRSETRVFRARWTLTPRMWQYLTASDRV